MSIGSISRVENLVDCDQAGTRDDAKLLCEHHNSRKRWALRATPGGMCLEVFENGRRHYCHN